MQWPPSKGGVGPGAGAGAPGAIHAPVKRPSPSRPAASSCGTYPPRGEEMVYWCRSCPNTPLHRAVRSAEHLLRSDRLNSCKEGGALFLGHQVCQLHSCRALQAQTNRSTCFRLRICPPSSCCPAGGPATKAFLFCLSSSRQGLGFLTETA